MVAWFLTLYIYRARGDVIAGLHVCIIVGRGGGMAQYQTAGKLVT